MVAVTIGISLSYALERTVPIMPLVTGGLVVVFGGLTLAKRPHRHARRGADQEPADPTMTARDRQDTAMSVP